MGVDKDYPDKALKNFTETFLGITLNYLASFGKPDGQGLIIGVQDGDGDLHFYSLTDKAWLISGYHDQTSSTIEEVSKWLLKRFIKDGEND